jgi:phage-related protein (TIGR01555 family)
MTKKKLKNTTLDNGANEIAALGLAYGRHKNVGILMSDAMPTFLTREWWILANEYETNPIANKAIRLPVDNAFKANCIKLSSNALESAELELLEKSLNKEIQVIKDVNYWSRLFGGGSIVVDIPSQLSEKEIDYKKLKGEIVKFRALERWYCFPQGDDQRYSETFMVGQGSGRDYSNYVTLHRSKIKTLAPTGTTTLHRNYYNGYGLSLFERILTTLNEYIKGNRVILELLDEAKLNIIKIADFMSIMMTQDDEKRLRERLQLIADSISYKDLLPLDAQDEFDQRQLTFSGIPELIEMFLRIICGIADCPYSQMWGKGTAGFGSGKDEMEALNTSIEGNIRQPSMEIIHFIAKIKSYQLFGREIPDLKIELTELIMLSDIEQQQLKNQQIDNILKLYDRGLISDKITAELISNQGLINIPNEAIAQLDDEFVEPDSAGVYDVSGN